MVSVVITAMQHTQQPVDTDQLEAATGMKGMEQLIQALRSLGTPSPTTTTIPASPCRAPTFDCESNVEIFIQQFKDVDEGNCWKEKRALLQLIGSLQGSTQIYSWRETVRDIYTARLARHGISLPQAKEHLLGLSRDPQGSVSDFAV